MRRLILFFFLSLSAQSFCVPTRAYITNQTDGTVTVIDLSTNSVEATLTVGAGCQFSAATPNGHTVYVVNQTDNTVSVIDNTVTPPVVKTGAQYPITVENVPIGIAINSAGTRAYVANQFSNSISEIDTDPTSATVDTVLNSLPTSGATLPRLLAITPDQATLYVGSRNTNTITVYDLTTEPPTIQAPVMLTIGAPNSVGSFAIQPNTSSPVFATAPLSNEVRFFPNMPGAADMDPGGGYENPQFPAFTLDGTKVYIPNANSAAPGTVVLIDVTSPTVAAPNPSSPLNVDDNPSYVVINPAGTIAYVANNGSGTVSAINTSTQAITSIPTGGLNPIFAAVTSDNSKVVVSLNGSDQAAIIDVNNGNSVTTLSTGAGPQFVLIPFVATPTPPGPTPTPTPAAVAVVQAQSQAAAQQNLQTVNATINTALQDAQTTGILSTTQGTYPDTVNTYIIDNTTSYTVQVQLPPSWCQ